jgi:hypothetical protein
MDVVKRLRNHAMPDPHDEVLRAPLLREAADEIEKLRDATNVALGWLTGGMDGDWRDCDLVELLRNVLPPNARGKQCYD